MLLCGRLSEYTSRSQLSSFDGQPSPCARMTRHLISSMTPRLDAVKGDSGGHGSRNHAPEIDRLDRDCGECHGLWYLGALPEERRLERDVLANTLTALRSGRASSVVGLRKEHTDGGSVAAPYSKIGLRDSYGPLIAPESAMMVATMAFAKDVTRRSSPIGRFCPSTTT